MNPEEREKLYALAIIPRFRQRVWLWIKEKIFRRKPPKILSIGDVVLNGGSFVAEHVIPWEIKYGTPHDTNPSKGYCAPMDQGGFNGPGSFEQFVTSGKFKTCGNLFCQDAACEIHDDKYRAMVKKVLDGDNGAPVRYLEERYFPPGANPFPCHIKPPHTADCNVCGFRWKETAP